MNMINGILGKLVAIKDLFLKQSLVKKIIVIAVLIGIGWFTIPRIAGNKTQQPEYQTAQVELGTLITSVTASGTIGPNLETQQQTAAAWASFLSAQNSLNSAKSKMNALQSSLFAANQKFVNGAGTEDPITDDPTYIIQRADWLQAEADYNNQANVIQQAEAALSSAWLSYQQLSSMVVPNTTHAIVNLTEIDVVKVKTGQKVTLTLDAFPDKTFTGKVTAVNTYGSVSSGVTTYPTTITFDTAVDTIYPNMAVNATIITDMRNDVLLVPSGAVQASSGTSTVRVMKNGQVIFTQVEVGGANDTQTEILSGVSAGDTVITGQTSGITTPSATATSPFGNTRGGFGGAGGGQMFIQRR